MTAADKLVEGNTALVHACARRFAGKGVEYEELYSEGCVGLVKAARNFDESLGYKFSTYAVPVILGEIKRIFRDSGAVKVSRSLRELSLKVSREREAFVREKDREPRISELADRLCLSVQQVTEAIDCAQIPLSLSYASQEEDSKELDIVQESGEEAFTEKLSLYQAMESLEQKDRELIRLRFFAGQTQSATAQALGMTQVQVSRREKKILTLLREKLDQ
ncbi:MAG: sigma-70 family RNA polymerase sigma factor [Ruminococcus sp.]|nr:sigma-70 family RNA polymerase sigma factor [Ruminococcus sp.]